MKLISNTVLSFNNNPVNYEILLCGAFLIFKPFFYHLEGNLPCIVLTRTKNGWKLQEKFEKMVEDQVMDDIECLGIN
jgi:hypothetical protein